MRQSPRHRVELLQQILNSFWKWWTLDFFPCLVLRKKWDVQRRDVQVNDVVILVDSNAVRGNWAIGRITEVRQRQDKKVRNVTLKTEITEQKLQETSH